ncbi:MAG: Stenotrophomonas phage Moby, partial [Actinomycetota bacterium]
MVALVALTASTLVFVEAAPASAAIVTNNLVVNLDGTDTSSLAASSPTVWTSISPGSSNMSGTITNATRATGSTGGLNFVGTGTAGSYVNFGTGKGNVSGSITFDTWIKPGNLPANGWAIIASRWFDSPTVETTANHDFHFGIRTGASSGTLQLDTTTQTAALSGTTQFPLTGANKWYHVGFVIDSVSGKAQLFVNGVADSVQATMSHSGSANPQFWLGDGRLSASLAFNGTISKARLYGAALSQSNLFQNFNADSTLFGYGPVNTVTPTLAGTAKVGSTLQSTEGTWNDTTVLSTTYKWQSSPDGATWTDIAGAAASSYTTVTGDAGLYIRSAVTKTNGNGATTAFSAASLPVQTANGIIITNGGTLTGLTSTVPNDANIYQVTLASSNLSSTIAMPNNTGLTIVNGYATTASYMATAFTGAPIISFRGTGTAINSALATATYTGTVAQTDTVKLYYARGTATITDTDNYIPIYDNGKLTFHYYTYTGSATSSTWQSHQTTLQATSTQVGITSPYKWYLATPRYQIEDTRLKALVGSTTTVFLGGSSPSGTTNWYWAANSDGFTSATQFATGATGTSNIFNGASTTLPWQSSQPDYGSTGDRVLQYWYNTGPQGWDDTPSTTTGTAYASETFLTAPASSTGTQGVLAMTVRPSTAAGAPTALSASAPGSSVTLNWTAPASTGADAITDYVIQYSSDQTNWTTFTK